jgi:hypothetical protein
MSDTVWAACRTAAAVALLGMSLVGLAWADPSPLPAKVVWTNAGRVYIASKDTLALEAGDIITFYSKKKLLASGTVTAVHDGVLAAVLLGSGSLDKFKKLDRVLLFGEKPRLAGARVLRFGWPSSTRVNLLFHCARVTPRSPSPGPQYRAGVLDGHTYRLVRTSPADLATPGADTLLIRLFDEVTDEEIALERGELDVALFWPGELSTHMRDDPRWRDFLRGTRTKGLLAVQAPRDGPMGFTPADSSALLSLNEEVFLGDLALWNERVTSRGSAPTTPPQTSRRFEVDHSCPGWQIIERSLNRGKGLGPASGELSPLRVMYIDQQIGMPDQGGFLFAIRCPVVCAPSLRAYVRALGPDALVDMVECWGASGKP